MENDTNQLKSKNWILRLLHLHPAKNHINNISGYQSRDGIGEDETKANVDSLVQSGHIESIGDDRYQLTEKGTAHTDTEDDGTDSWMTTAIVAGTVLSSTEDDDSDDTASVPSTQYEGQGGAFGGGGAGGDYSGGDSTSSQDTSSQDTSSQDTSSQDTSSSSSSDASSQDTSSQDTSSQDASSQDA